MEKRETFYVTGMSCAGCAMSVEQVLSQSKGVKEAKVNFAASMVMVEYDESVVTPTDLQEAVQAAGYDLILEEETESDIEIRQRKEYHKLRQNTIGAIVFSLPVFIIGMLLLKQVFWLLRIAIRLAVWLVKKTFILIWKLIVLVFVILIGREVLPWNQPDK